MAISAQDRKRISDAIRAAEARTSGEIVCVLARTSSHVMALPIFLAAVAAMALQWVLVAFTEMPVYSMLSLQAIVFIVLTGILCLPRVRVALIPQKVRRAVAHRVALAQFTVRGIGQKNERSGILIFVSLVERYARIIADDGIAARVPQAHWQTAIDALVAHMRDGRIGDGFVTAIDLCGSELAQHFPGTGANPDQLPDRIHLI
jgi:putative membrane protein